MSADGGASHSRQKSWQHNRNRNWNGDENQDLSHTRLRLHNRNNDIAVARARPENARNNVHRVAAACLDSATLENREFVGVARNGQILIQEVTLTPNPTPSFWRNSTGAFTTAFPGFTPVCVDLSITEASLQVIALGADGRVLQTACTINPPPAVFPGNCGVPVDLGIAAASGFNA